MITRTSPRCPSAVHHEVMAGYIRCGVGQEERHGARNLFGFSDAAQRRFFGQPLYKLGMIPLHDFFWKWTRRNAIGSHVLFSPMNRQVSRHLNDSGLSDAIL